MAKILYAALLCVCASPAFAGDVGVSITLGQPGFFGQIEIGNAPQPQVIYQQPVVVVQSPAYVSAPPIYLHVPPGHEKHWNKHCAQYNACGRPVYFVRDDWYNNEYVPRYQQGDDGGHGHGKGHDKHNDHDEGHGHQDH
jgi:hypothetical protein